MAVDDIPEDAVDQTEIFDVDSVGKEKEESEPEQLYRIYSGSKIPISRQVGIMWKRKFDAAMKAYESTHAAWNQVFQYYNNDQTKSMDTPRGVFKRGDGTENVVYSNLNTMLPAVYSKNPDIQCSTSDKDDEGFCDSLKTLLNTILRRRDKLNAKPKVKRAAGFGLLTNFGILRIDWTKKDDSRELAIQELAKLSKELEKAKTQEVVGEIYGKMHALEQQMEIRQPNGPGMRNVLPHNLIIDPYAEDNDGLDGNWMIERCFELTAGLNARFTEEDPETKERHLIYKPTHKAVFAGEDQGSRDDGVGLVMQSMAPAEVDKHTTEERTAFINMYYTECYLVWDKTMNRVMLFSRDDWTWPIWVWDASEIMNVTRFFPYFIIGYGMSTGGTVSVGEVSYYLDQQDEINDINRQIARIRRALFDYFFYNSAAVNADEAEKFFRALRGETQGGSHILGVDAGEGGDISKMVQAFLPPSAQYEPFFNKEPILNSINRVTNTSDALRGVQFKTNTNESAVDTYQESARLAVGAKVDVIEDVMSDLAYTLGELCIQNYTKEEVEGLIGRVPAEGYEQVPLELFRSMYSVEVVAGSMEKPNSMFKKKEAVQIAQGIGQFAQAAPGTSLRIMLRVLEKAFTEVVIHKEDWNSLDQEIQATMQKGISTQGGPAQAGQEQTAPGAEGAGDPRQALLQQAQNLPPEVKQQIMQMKTAGKSNEEIMAFIQSKMQGASPQQTGATNGQATS